MWGITSAKLGYQSCKVGYRSAKVGYRSCKVGYHIDGKSAVKWGIGSTGNYGFCIMSVSGSGSGTLLFTGVFDSFTATASKCWKPDDRLTEKWSIGQPPVPAMPVFTGKYSGNGNCGNSRNVKTQLCIR